MIKIDNVKCIGCGSCGAVCPQNFKLTDEGKAEVIDQKLRPCVHEAKELCPTEAIEIINNI